jgi:hypothetical protein
MQRLPKSQVHDIDKLMHHEQIKQIIDKRPFSVIKLENFANPPPKKKHLKQLPKCIIMPPIQSIAN